MNYHNNLVIEAVVVAQLAEQLLPTSEVRGSNPVIGKILYLTLVITVNCFQDKKTKKRPRMAH